MTGFNARSYMVWMPFQVHRKLKMASVQKDKTINDLIVNFIEKGLQTDHLGAPKKSADVGEKS